MDEEISLLIQRLCPIRDSSSSVEVQHEAARALLVIAKQSDQGRSRVINAVIELLEGAADEGCGWGPSYKIGADILGELRAIEAIDVLVKYLDMQTSPHTLSLNSFPSVKAIVRIGEAAIPKLTKAVISGRSALGQGRLPIRLGAVEALQYIGGDQAKEALELAYSGVRQKTVRGMIQVALVEMAKSEDEEKSLRRPPVKRADFDSGYDW